MQALSTPEERSTVASVATIAAVSGAALGAYHGYKRNKGSVGWAIGWAFFGSLLPILAIPIALAQGVGKPARK